MKKLLASLFFAAIAVGSFAQINDVDLRAQTDVIRNETIPLRNTPIRVGDWGRNLVSSKLNINQLASVVVTGTDTYVASVTPAINSYTTPVPLKVWVKFTNANATTTPTVNLNGLGAKSIVNADGDAIAIGDLPAGSIRPLLYDGVNFRIMYGGGGGGGGSTLFAADIPVVLSGGKSLGQYTNGQTIPSTGKTAEQVMNLIATEYINPVFNAFSISGQSNTVEVGTTLSGSNTFTWTITVGSGTVPTIDLYNNTTSATLLAGTPNDGTQAQTITTIQLNSNGSTQSWKGIGNNTSPSGTFNSSNFVVTARYYRWWDAISSSLTNSASVRALTNAAFNTSGNSFTLNSGTTLTKFVVALPPGTTIVTVNDLDALGADITSSFVAQSSINVLDAGSTNRAYNIYEYNVGVAYGSNHRFSIVTN